MEVLNVSDIQHFSTGDGPGIRTTVFLKGCNLHCPWCHNPETISAASHTLTFAHANRTQTYGCVMTAQQVLAQVLEDEDFYRASGGGVTFSGGEPLLQADGVAEVAKALGAQGIPVVVDTAGCVPWERFATVLDVTDLFYFDYKTPYPDAYREVVGGDQALVYGNLCRLIASGAHVHVRVPLIPGINTSAEACAKACEQLCKAGVRQVDLLPFHRMGTGKYQALGQAYAYADVPPPSPAEIAEIASIYQQYFEVTIE